MVSNATHYLVLICVFCEELETNFNNQEGKEKIFHLTLCFLK